MSGAFPERRVSVITLGVADRAVATRFYEEVLGFRNVGPSGLTLFDLGGFALCLWEREKLADDAGLPEAAPVAGVFRGFSLSYNARAEDEVDAIFARLAAAGARITKAPHKAFWGGRTGYFLDPDGHSWEVAYNPYWPIDADGRLTLPGSAPKAASGDASP